MSGNRTIISAILGIFLVETYADLPDIRAITEDSPLKLGKAVRLESATRSRSLVQGPQIMRQQAAVSDGAPEISGFDVDTSSRLANLVDYHCHYTFDGDENNLIGWTGNVASCDQGTISASYQDLVLRRINYFRGQAGLDTTISFDTAKNDAALQAALVMVRQKNLSHTPLTDWPTNPCVSAASEVTASASNLALGSFGMNSIDRLMLDDGTNNGPVGHRRWFLYPQATEMGHGSIPFVPNYTSACVVWVVGDFGAVPAAKPVTWPNEGYCPYTLVPNNTAEYARWSFSYPQADFTTSSISMIYNGADVTVTKEPLQRFIGDNTLVWRAQDIPSTPPAAGTDSIATVTISGIRNAPFTTYTYNVVIYDPFDLQESMALTGPEAPTVAGKSSYQFNSITEAEGYRLRVANQAPVDWTEGAESLDGVLDSTSSSYPLQSTTLSSGGSRSFHLLFPSFGEQSFEIDRTVIPSTDSVLQFKKRFRFFYPHSRFRAELSDNDGASWTTLYEEAGTNVSGSSAEWDGQWIPISEPIPDSFANRPIRLRFRIQTNGSFFQWNPGNTTAHYGVFVDDIKLTESSQILHEQVTNLDGTATSFQLNDVTAGADLSTENAYLLQIAPVVAGHQFTFTPPVTVHPNDERADWQELHFGSAEVSEETAPQSDTDQDGLSNLIERALGLDPTQPDEQTATAILPSGSLGASGRPSLGMSIPSAPHADITYEVQQSSNLVTWTTLTRKEGPAAWEVIVPGTTVEEGSEANGRVQLFVKPPSDSGDGNLHLRLSVSTAE